MTAPIDWESYWNLNELTGTRNDAGDYARHIPIGAGFESLVPVGVPGVVGNCIAWQWLEFRLDGRMEWVVSTASPNAFTVGNFTLIFWFKGNVAGTTATESNIQIRLIRTAGGGTPYIYMDLKVLKAQTQIGVSMEGNDGVGHYVYSAQTDHVCGAKDAWHVFALVVGNASLSMWVDNAYVKQIAWAGRQPQLINKIMFNPSVGHVVPPGCTSSYIWIDEMRLYRRALTNDELLAYSVFSEPAKMRFLQRPPCLLRRK